LHENPVEAELVETQKEQKAPRIPATFKNPAKILDKSRFPVPENWPFEPSWVGRDCSIHPLKKIPTHEIIHRFFHSSPVQEQSNPTNPPKTHSKSNASPKKPSTRSSKNSNQNLPVSPKFLQKKTGFSWMTQRLIKIFRIVR
jgi:hypothetical protein